MALQKVGPGARKIGEPFFSVSKQGDKAISKKTLLLLGNHFLVHQSKVLSKNNTLGINRPGATMKK